MSAGSAARFSKKSAALLFVGVLLAYIFIFHGIEYWRQRQGPWIVRFATNDLGYPLVDLKHNARGIEQVRLIFEGESTAATNLPVILMLDKPRQPLPFGRRLHEDLIILPGVETWDLFGHLIEFAPRRLLVNGREYAWSPTQTITVSPTNKPASEFPAADSIKDRNQ